MKDFTYREYIEDETLRAEVERAARRERALTMKRFLEQSARALFGERRRQPVDEMCAAC